MKLNEVLFVCLIGVASISTNGGVHAEPADEQAQAAHAAEVQATEEGQEVEGFKLLVKMSKKKYAVGEPMTLDVTFKNVSRDRVHITTRGYDLTYKLEILRPDGTLAPLTPRGEVMRKGANMANGGSGREYKVGEKEEYEMQGATVYFDMTQIGDYQLRVSRSVPKRPENRKDAKDEEATLYSNIITVRIGAPKAKDDAMTTTETQEDAEATDDAPQDEAATDEAATDETAAP
jgi:hypothetical protein